MNLFPQNLTTLERVMDLRMENQRVIASNLANIDTPGYTAQRLDFEASMQNALESADAPPVIEPSAEPSRSADGNNVDMEVELGQMSRNRILYSVSSQLMASKLRQYSTMLDAEHQA